MYQKRAIKKMLPGIYMKFTLRPPITGYEELLCIIFLTLIPENYPDSWRIWG
jgi:hypothetical protein